MDTRNYTFGSSPASIGTGSLTATQRVADPSPESESKIRNIVSTAEETLSMLHASISHLESRLDTALTPLPPATPASTSAQQAMPILSHLSERAVRVNQGLQEAVIRLQSLRDRVEI